MMFAIKGGGDMVEKLYVPKEVAKILGVSVFTVLNLLKSGRLHGFQIVRRWRIAPEDLDKFMKRKKPDQHVDEAAQITKKSTIPNISRRGHGIVE